VQSLWAGSTRVQSIHVRRCAPRIRLLGKGAIGRIVIQAFARGEPVALDRVVASVLGEGDPRTPLYGFPDVVLHADELAVKRHPQFGAANAGAISAAESLVANLANSDRVQAIQALLEWKQAELVTSSEPTALTGKPYSAKLAPDDAQIQALRDKHGQEFENWWRQRFGFGFAELTRSEARYLENSPDAHTIRGRLVAAGLESGSGPSSDADAPVAPSGGI
jgi:hypothetical protein